MTKLRKLIGKPKIVFLLAVFFCIVLFSSFNKIYTYTSTDNYCMSCHMHPHAEVDWRLSVHNNNHSGVTAHCADCHLPPKENGIAAYTYAKAKHGSKDLYGYLFKDADEIDWETKRQPEKARHFVYEESCINCHNNFFPSTLSDKGSEAHLNYSLYPKDRTCITCHIDVGHFDPVAHSSNLDFGFADVGNKKIYTSPTSVTEFVDFEEKIPGTPVSFNMKALKAGKFVFGSPVNEAFRQRDEGPQREVEVKQFWMGEIEVSWYEYLAFFSATSSQGRKEADATVNEEVDGISGATPPWGAPDQGWGKGKRPAITMSHHAAMTYCRWLSQVTGKKYRLPTEAEWEYAARGGTSGTFFFDGEPKDFMKSGILNKIFGAKTEGISSYVVYEGTSPDKTQDPSFVEANPFGLKNMLGNVAEFCLDYYDPAVYGKYPKGVVKNPRGPRKGTEHVVRGGSFSSSAKDLRIANREYTRTKDWLVTDPQIPKSIWWYSDSKNVGFRVVCEFESNSK